MLTPDPVDKLFWELITCVPLVSQNIAYTAGIMNIIIPGFGTILAACWTKTDGPVSKAQICIGILQFLTSFFVIGWIWSMYWGYLIYIQQKNEDQILSQQQVLAGQK